MQSAKWLPLSKKVKKKKKKSAVFTAKYKYFRIVFKHSALVM